MADKSQFCMLVVGDERFALPVDRVQELIRNLVMTPIALAPSVIRGLINLRGQIVMAIDLKHRLGIPEESDQAAPMNVVVHSDDGLISLLVDDVTEVVELFPEDCDAVPTTVRKEIRSLLRGVYQLSTSLLFILDTDKVLDFPCENDMKHPG